MKDFLGACLLGALLGAMIGYGVPAKAQTYVVTNPQGNVQGYIQKQDNQVNFVTTKGVVTPYTVYPNQIVSPTGYAIGTPSYTVPSTPSSPPSPRVLQ